MLLEHYKLWYLFYYLPLAMLELGLISVFFCDAGPSDHVGLDLQCCISLLLIMVCTGIIIMSQ